MQCRECPFIKEDFERRISDCRVVDETVLRACEKACWCAKVGGILSVVGQCSDADGVVEVFSCSQPPRSNKKTKRERLLAYKRRIKFLANNVRRYPSPAYYKEELFVDFWHSKTIPLHNPRYVRLYRGNHNGNAYQYYKRVANKSVRRYKRGLHNGSQYKKVFDYWWTVD